METFTLSLSQAQAIQGINASDEVIYEETPLLVPGEKISNGDDPEAGEADESPPTKKQKEQRKVTFNLPPEEQLPTEINATNDAESFQSIVETVSPEVDATCKFRKILQHVWNDGTLMMKAQYTDTFNGTFEIDTPFKKLKMDEPLACAKYIREYVPESRRGDRPLNDWAIRTIKTHSNLTRRMVEINSEWWKEDDDNANLIRALCKYKLQQKIKLKRIRRSGPSRNQKWMKMKNKEKFGIKIPNSIAEALQFDREAGNDKWRKAIEKEMDNLKRLNVFKFHSPDKVFSKEEGWQKAPIRMIFDIKNEDQRYKARLVVGGHKVDSTEYNTYSSQVDGMSVMLLFLIAQ